MPEHTPAPEVPEYVSVTEALDLIGDRFACSRVTLRRQGVHKLLGRYSLGYRGGRTAVRRIPLPAVEEVMRIMHEGRIPEE